LQDRNCTSGALRLNGHIFVLSLGTLSNAPTVSMPAAALSYYILCARDLRMLAIFLTRAVGQLISGVHQSFITKYDKFPV